MLPLILLPVFYLFYHMHNHPGQTSSNPLPTSLSYLYDTDQEQGFFYQYDHINTEWCQAFFATTQGVEDIATFRKTYKKPLLRLNQVDQPVALSPMPVTTRVSWGPEYGSDMAIDDILEGVFLSGSGASWAGRILYNPPSMQLSIGPRRWMFPPKPNTCLSNPSLPSRSLLNPSLPNSTPKTFHPGAPVHYSVPPSPSMA